MATVTIHGLQQLRRDLNAIDKKVTREFGNELKKAADPVAQAARGKVSRYRGASVNTIRPKRSGLRIFVEQSKAKTTGRRGDFGALQMRTVLIPALEENEGQVIDNIDDVLGRWTSGF